MPVVTPPPSSSTSSTQTVATQQVFDYIYDTAGKPVANARVIATLNYTQASDLNPIVEIGPISQSTITDSNGYWTFNLVPNASLTPSGTLYTIQTPFTSYDISVPGSGGAFQSTQILANVPAVLSPAVTGLVGPITVTGDETVTGNFTVNGNTTLSGTTVGALTAAATTVGGDLTIGSAFRLLFGAAVSKVVAGATSLSLRNHADNADNVLVADSGNVTVRGTLASGPFTSTGEIAAPDLKASGLTGATNQARMGGATVAGAPASGTWAVDDVIYDQNGNAWICVTAGTPGTWRRLDGWFGVGSSIVGSPSLNTRFFLQAGTSAPTTDGNATAAITFPNAFPTGVLTVVECPGDNSPAGVYHEVLFSTVSTTGFSIKVFVNNVGQNSVSTRANWLAVGF